MARRAGCNDVCETENSGRRSREGTAARRISEGGPSLATFDIKEKAEAFNASG
jgi:hypothetical protein